MQIRHLSPILASLILSVSACNKPSESTESEEAVATSEEAAEANAEENAPEEAQPLTPAELRTRAAEVFEPLPTEPNPDLNPDMVALGQQLYHDTRLSGDGTLSCASCHDIAAGGADGRAGSIGINGQIGPISSPTVLNSSYNLAQFWDGRAATLEEQASGPVANPVEMGADWETVLQTLSADEAYAAAFGALFEDGVTEANATRAIADFERTLITPNDGLDRFLRGDDSALSEAAQRGLASFMDLGCTACHTGPAIGGSMFQKMGLVQNYFELRGGDLTTVDQGRFNVTQQESDRHSFRVPTLRNIARTAPYFHDGHATNLSDAVTIMAQVQLGQTLTDEQTADIVAFLEALNGDIPDVVPAP